jgi:hypothetical protein
MQRPTEKKKNEQNNDLQNTEKRSKEQATPTKNLEENIKNKDRAKRTPLKTLKKIL